VPELDLDTGAQHVHLAQLAGLLTGSPSIVYFIMFHLACYLYINEGVFVPFRQ
jgi:hypothetical protein